MTRSASTNTAGLMGGLQLARECGGIRRILHLQPGQPPVNEWSLDDILRALSDALKDEGSVVAGAAFANRPITLTISPPHPEDAR